MLNSIIDLWGTIIIVGAVCAVVGFIVKIFVAETSYQPSSTEQNPQQNYKETKTSFAQNSQPLKQPINYRRAKYDPEEYCFMNDCISPERCKFCGNCVHSERGTKAHCTAYDISVNDNCVCDQFYDPVFSVNSVSNMNR